MAMFAPMVVRSLPRFVDSTNYAASFGYQWKAFARTQVGGEQTRVSKIRFDATNLIGNAAIGIDNIQFGQVAVTPPPPQPAKISGNVFNDTNRDGVRA